MANKTYKEKGGKKEKSKKFKENRSRIEFKLINYTTLLHSIRLFTIK